MDTVQAVVDQAPQAATSDSDGFATYRDLVYAETPICDSMWRGSAAHHQAHLIAIAKDQGLI